jgi:hypothetical protein
MKLEYVVSGTSYMRLSNPRVLSDEVNVALVNSLLEKVRDQNGHEFSMLYNGHTESGFGEKFMNWRGNIKNVHADSGGLQVVTQGLDLTDELKDEVYRNQAKWADIGMCFDEIPIVKTGLKSDRNATKDRWFDQSRFEEFARKTGKNVARQIEIFKEEDSKCRPFVILQGNDIDTYMEWENYILDEIPDEDHKYIGGVAIGAAALGTGNLEDIQRAFIASQSRLRGEDGTLHIHILGVGAIRRLLPYLIFTQNGLYGKVQISYDSTTHSRAVETGLFYNGTRSVKFNRQLSNHYIEMLDDIQEMWPLKITVEDFHKKMNTNSTNWLEEHNDLNSWMEARTAMCLKSIYNFCRHADKIHTNKDELLAFARRLKLEHAYRNLYNIKDRQDFDYWFNSPYLGQTMKSAPVATEAPATLEDLFG